MVVQECARVNWFLISKEVSSCKALVCFGYGFEFSLRCVLFSQTFPFVALRFAGAKSTTLQHSKEPCEAQVITLE